VSAKLVMYNSDTALLSFTTKHEFLIETQLISCCQSLLFRAANVSATYLVVTFTMLSIMQKTITPNFRTGNHVVGSGYGPRRVLSGNFLVLTEEKREDFSFEQFVSY
jgi:hypothetical protein